MSSIVELARVITPENRAEVLPRFLHCSKQEAKAISAELAPRKVVPHREVVTALRTTAAPTASLSFRAPAETPEPPPVSPSPRVHPVELGDPVRPDATFQLQPPPPRRLEVEPLTATESRLHITVSRPFLKKLEDARLALSHSMPGADAEAILSAGLDLLLARDAKNKALVEKPRSMLADVEDALDSDKVPAAVEREVRKRDGNCCQWPLDSGGICGSRFQTQLDHIIPKSRGGKPVLKNLRVLCEPHNKLAAWQKLGPEVMNRYCRDPRLPLFSGHPGDTSGG
jgi:hypothetical protein